mgnify:CR=1 FL=1
MESPEKKIREFIIKIDDLVAKEAQTVDDQLLFCAGDTAVWNTNLGSSYTYSWSNNQTTEFINITSPGDYSVEITDLNGCNKFSDTLTFVMDNYPNQISLGNDTSFCAGNSISLVAGASTTITYNWSNNPTNTSSFNSISNIFVEAESANIGKCKIPHEFFNQMKRSRRIEILRSESNRLDELINTYSIFKKEELQQSVLRIKKRLGPQRTKIALESISKERWDLVCRSVLDYYDRCYEYEKVGKENITLLDLTDKKYDKKILELINNVL